MREAEEICRRVVRFGDARFRSLDRKIDDVVTSRVWGIPIMVLLLGVVFWLTIRVGVRGVVSHGKKKSMARAEATGTITLLKARKGRESAREAVSAPTRITPTVRSR